MKCAGRYLIHQLRRGVWPFDDFLYFDPVIGQQVRVRFDTDEFNLQIEPSRVADGKPIVSWNNLVLIEVLPPNY